MLFLPPESFTIETKLTVKEVSFALRPFVQREYEEGVIGGQSSDLFFIGYVRHDSFTIHRATSMRNYWPPVFEGTILPQAVGSKVEVVVDYSFSGKIVLVGVVSAFAIIAIGAFLLPSDEPDPGSGYYALIPLVSVGIILCVSFAFEVIVSRNKLIRIIKGKVREGSRPREGQIIKVTP